MKILSILIFCLLPQICLSQKMMNFSTDALLVGKEVAADGAMVTRSTGERAWQSSTGQDTLTTKWVLVEHLNAEFGLEFRKINISGTDNVQVDILLFRGQGAVDSSGISRHPLITSTADLVTNIWFSDSTFVSKRGFTRYALEIKELAAQRNDYIINFNHFSPDGQASGANLRN